MKKKSKITLPRIRAKYSYSNEKVRSLYIAQTEKKGVRATEFGFKKFRADVNKKIRENRIKAGRKRVQEVSKATNVNTWQQQQLEATISNKYGNFKTQSQYKKFIKESRKVIKTPKISNVKKLLPQKSANELTKEMLAGINTTRAYVNALFRDDFEFYKENRDDLIEYNTQRKNGEVDPKLFNKLKNNYAEYRDEKLNKRASDIADLL